jgi:type II secretory pathway pseudopilin PulG
MPIANHPKNHGDTLIEVLFAMAVFSLVAVSSMSIMNQGTATSQRALEITLVRQEMNAQAETLRFINASYIMRYESGKTSYPDTPADEWIKIKAKADSSVSKLDIECRIPDDGFVLNTHTAKFANPSGSSRPKGATTFSQVVYNANVITAVEGIWIEAIKSSNGDVPENRANYVDFHIRACWASPGQSVPMTLGTIVRLYEPRG